MKLSCADITDSELDFIEFQRKKQDQFSVALERAKPKLAQMSETALRTAWCRYRDGEHFSEVAKTGLFFEINRRGLDFFHEELLREAQGLIGQSVTMEPEGKFPGGTGVITHTNGRAVTIKFETGLLDVDIAELSNRVL